MSLLRVPPHYILLLNVNTVVHKGDIIENILVYERVQGHPEYRAPSWLMHRFSIRSTSLERKEETEKILSVNSFDLSLRRK